MTVYNDEIERLGGKLVEDGNVTRKRVVPIPLRVGFGMIETYQPDCAIRRRPAAKIPLDPGKPIRIVLDGRQMFDASGNP